MDNRFFKFFLVACIFPYYAAAQTANRYDVVIDELFPDPTPQIGLPGSEFIELKNVSVTPFNLQNWKISDGTSAAIINSGFILKPDSFVIICSNSAVASFAPFGSTIGVSSFPSLNNDADVIALYSAEGKIIHSIGYNISWYQNDVKSGGGWTLEMIDTRNPCGGLTNWTSSTDNTGGTPGKKNSVDAINKDELPPALVRSYTIDDTTVVAVFDETLDSNNAAVNSNYRLDNGIGNVSKAIPMPPLFTEVKLILAINLSSDAVYNLHVDNISDCAGNTIGMMKDVKAGLPVVADSMDIVINEILFNPKADGYDYIELYNRSNHIIDLRQLYLSNRSAAGSLVNVGELSSSPRLLFPGEYVVLTENKKWLTQNYIVKNPDQVLELSSLPSLPDDAGDIVCTNLQGHIIDELKYEHTWHFALINNEEGIALERIEYNQPTQNKSNWTSAASTAGFGTPGYQNSQLRTNQQLQGEVSVSPKVFSPDNDGIDDYATINYQLAEAGFVANITVFDANGRIVRYLSKNTTLSQTGYFRWDGLDDKGRPLSVGIYIIYTEVFNLNGKTKKFKNAVTIARKF